MKSPAAGTVQEVYFRVGETVQPGRPIVSILPPQNVKVRFFVPQAMLPGLRIGDRVLIACDGCRTDLTARISFISAQAEFTPPVIYSLEERARLVFRLEAVPDRPEELKIGQPASVALQEPTKSGTAHAQK
jgi:HlyD family secretion protein